MNSVFSNIRDEHVRLEPFPHILHTQALEPDYYRKLADEIPDPRRIFPNGWGENNQAFVMSGVTAIEKGLATPIWREFFDYHCSKDFYLEIVKFFGDQIRRVHPDLEAQLGKSLESLTVAPRKSGLEADVLLDCQFGINSPVREKSRVRTVHVDSPKKLYNALLYMRCDEDDEDGGDLEICRFKDRPRFWEVSTPDDFIDVVDYVRYRANTLIFMINSPHALHGVTPRNPSRHYRRYINFLAELSEPIFDLAPYQDQQALVMLQDTTPWALMMGGGKGDGA